MMLGITIIWEQYNIKNDFRKSRNNKKRKPNW